MQAKWSEKKIATLAKEGRGQGTFEDYKPWITIRDISSLGRKHLVPGGRFGRDIHLLSDIEYGVYLLLERSPNVLELYEQFPLDRDVTQSVAAQLGIKHPCYPGTNIPVVMTVDFMTATARDGQRLHEAFDAKDDSAFADARTVEKLEISRAALELMEIRHHIVLGSQLPQRKVANLKWIHHAEVRPGEVEPTPGYFDEMALRFHRHFTSAARATPGKSLQRVCAEFDSMHGTDVGTGLRVARILMVRRELGPDLDQPDLLDAPLSTFFLANHRGLQLARKM